MERNYVTVTLCISRLFTNLLRQVRALPGRRWQRAVWLFCEEPDSSLWSRSHASSSPSATSAPKWWFGVLHAVFRDTACCLATPHAWPRSVVAVDITFCSSSSKTPINAPQMAVFGHLTTLTLTYVLDFSSPKPKAMVMTYVHAKKRSQTSGVQKLE